MPQDGKNLNRCFPGSQDGTYSDVLARHVFDTLIAPSDFLLDLHGGDMVEALEPFSLYDESPVEEQARGARDRVRPALSSSARLPATRRSAARPRGAAAAAGVPAVIAEVGGCGLLEEEAVRMHLDGLENALRHLGMLPGDVTPPRADMRSVGRFVWLRCDGGGLVGAGRARRRRGSCRLEPGDGRNLFGDVTEHDPGTGGRRRPVPDDEPRRRRRWSAARPRRRALAALIDRARTAG